MDTRLRRSTFVQFGAVGITPTVTVSLQRRTDGPGPRGGVHSRTDRRRPVGAPRSGSAGQAICRLLEEDPELGQGLAAPVRERALQECRARVVCLGRVRCGRALPAPGPGGIGLLVLDGLLVRLARMGGRASAELIGEGDLICAPSRPELAEADASDWRVLAPARVAVLDAAAAHRLARYPPLTERLVARALERVLRLSVNMAIVHHARIEVRLELLLRHLAARFGRVRPDGVHVPLPLTHSVLADLVAAQRPSVTSALRRLAEQGRVHSTPAGWLLVVEPRELDAGAVPVAEDEARGPMPPLLLS